MNAYPLPPPAPPAAPIASVAYGAAPGATGRTVAAVVAGVLLGLAGLVALLLVAVNPAGFLLALIFASLSVPAVWAFYWWLGRQLPEPMQFRIFAFAWGAVVSVVIGLLFSLALIVLIGGGMNVAAVVVAPVVEEAAKGAGVLLIVWWRRHEFKGIVDGIVYAGLIGLGFAFTENALYYVNVYVMEGGGAAGAGAATGLFVARGIFSPFLHPLATGMIGIGVGVAARRRGGWWVAGPVLGYFAAVGVHGLWNSLAVSMNLGLFLGVYVVVMLPMLGVFIWYAARIRRREVTVVRDRLADFAAAGWLHPDEIGWVVDARNRRLAIRTAHDRLGPQTARAIREYQMVFVRLALLRAAILAGTAGPDGMQRLYALGQVAMAWRPFVRFPPTPRPLAHGYPGPVAPNPVGQGWTGQQARLPS